MSERRESGWWWWRDRTSGEWLAIKVNGWLAIVPGKSSHHVLGYFDQWGTWGDRIPEAVESAPLTGLERIALTSEQEAAIERGEMVEVRYPDGKL